MSQIKKCVTCGKQCFEVRDDTDLDNDIPHGISIADFCWECNKWHCSDECGNDGLCVDCEIT